MRRGIRRGELPKDTSVTFLFHALCGGAMNHALATPPELRANLAASAGEYAEEFVDFVVTSVLVGMQPD